jgi:hypothetical protein
MALALIWGSIWKWALRLAIVDWSRFNGAYKFKNKDEKNQKNIEIRGNRLLMG